MFPALRVAFEKRLVRVPAERAIREDLHSMQRVSTTAGGVTYRAPHSEDGHADRCTALALCVRAAATGTAGMGSGRIYLFENTRRSQAVMRTWDRGLDG